METKVILEDGVAIGDKKLREIYEVINYKKAYRYVKKCITENKPLDENTVCPFGKRVFTDFVLKGKQTRLL